MLCLGDHKLKFTPCLSLLAWPSLSLLWKQPHARGGSALANWAFIPHPIIAIQFCRMRLSLK